MTWLTNTKRHFGVLAKLPAPDAPAALCPLVHAASSDAVAAAPPPAKACFSRPRREVLGPEPGGAAISSVLALTSRAALSDRRSIDIDLTSR